MEQNSSTTNKELINILNIFKSENIYVSPEFVNALLNNEERNQEEKGFTRVLKKDENNGKKTLYF